MIRTPTAILLTAMVVAGCGGNPVKENPPTRVVDPKTYMEPKEVYREYSGGPNYETGKIKKGNFVRIETKEWGKTVVYDTDLGQMTLTLGRNGVYKDVVHTVPYGLCLDYIEENLGKSSGGWRLVAIRCEKNT